MFLIKFFPLDKINTLCGEISSFQQTGLEWIAEAWERLQEYTLAYLHHGMDLSSVGDITFGKQPKVHRRTVLTKIR